MTDESTRAFGLATLQSILDALNRHVQAAIMAFFDDDCVCEMPRRPRPGVHASSVATRCARHWSAD
jgi:hypothetical protein